MIFCCPARFPTCTLSWDHLCFPGASPPVWQWGSALVLKPQAPTWTLLHLLPCEDLERRDEWMLMLFPPNSSPLPGHYQTVPGDIPSYLVIHTGDLSAQAVTLCWFMPSSTHPRYGSRESTGDCCGMAPILEGKFGEGQRAPELALGAGSKDLHC